MKPIRINKALGRQAKIFFIDVEHIPAILACAAISFFISGVLSSSDWAVPILIFISLFGAWLITVRKNPKKFVAAFHKNHPPNWKRGRVYYTSPLSRKKSR